MKDVEGRELGDEKEVKEEGGDWDDENWWIRSVNHFNDAYPLHSGAARRPNKQCVIRAGEWEMEMV